MTKRCNTCGEEKPLEDFYLAKKGGTKRQGRCKSCERARDRRCERDTGRGRVEVVRLEDGTLVTRRKAAS